MTDMHCTGMVSGQLPGIRYKRSVASKFTWPMDYHVWGAMLEAYHKFHPKSKSTKLRRSIAGDLGQPVMGTDQRGC